MNVSLRLAEHVVRTRFEDLPPRVVEVTKRSLLDALGVTLAASRLGEGCGAFAELAREQGGRPESTVLGFGWRVPAAAAALANGSMAHALDFEDAHDAALVHPNAPTVPAALAVAEALGGVSGSELLTALAVGCDLVCRLGLAFDESPAEFGWYPPPILGAFGAAAAASRLLGLGEDQVLDAFSLTLCQATCSAELKDSPHSVVRAVRDAFAAKAGVLSAELARRGIRGFELPFEGKAGFFALYGRGNYSPERLLKDLGRTFEGANVSFKPWPTCRGTHASIDGALRLASEHALPPDAVEAIRLTGGSLNRMLWEPVEQKKRPATAIDAKFSLPFAVATALKHRAVTLAHFTPEALTDPDVLALADRTVYTVGEDPGGVSEEATWGLVEIRTRDGGHYATRVEHPSGHPKNPLPLEALVAKFEQCASQAVRPLPPEEVHGLVETVLGLERSTVSALVGRFGTDGP